MLHPPNLQSASRICSRICWRFCRMSARSRLLMTPCEKLVKRHLEMRAKRSDSQPPPVANQRPRIAGDDSKRVNFLSSLLIEPNADNTAGYLSFPGKFRLLVKGKQWASWSQGPSKIPMYILEALFDPKHDIASIPEMELVNECIPRHGSRDDQNIILEQISPKGVIFLQTKYCESELGFSCTARPTKCSGTAQTMVGPDSHRFVLPSCGQDVSATCYRLYAARSSCYYKRES